MSVPTSAHVDALSWNVSIIPSPFPNLQCPLPSSQRPFLPMLPNTELFLLNFHCIHSAPHFLAFYGFLSCFISPAKLHVPSGQGSAKGASYQPLQTQLRIQRKNSHGCASTPKKYQSLAQITSRPLVATNQPLRATELIIIKITN